MKEMARRERDRDIPENAIGIDLGGTTTRIGAYGKDWNLLECITVQTKVTAGPDAAVAEMSQAVRTLAKQYAIKVKTVGIGSPGPLDLTKGQLLSLPNFPGWDNFPLKGALESALDLEVVLDSDANTATLAEFLLGAGRQKNASSMCMLTLGTGVGSGLIFNGDLWHGSTGMGGEVGHVSINPDGPECSCGGAGCLERYVSATAIVQRGKELLRKTPSSPSGSSTIDTLSAHEMAVLAKDGHPIMQELFKEVGYHLGLSLAQIANTLELPLYSIGGGVAEAWPLFAPSLFSTLRRYSQVYRLNAPIDPYIFEPEKPFVTPALLGPGAGLMGAAMLPFYGNINFSETS